MEVKAGYKQSEVGVIPEEWEVKTLGEVVDFLDGRRRPVKASDRAKMSGFYPYYGASGIVDYVNDYLFDQDLILLGEDGENILSRNSRLAFRVSGKIWVNNHAHVLQPKDGFDIGYLTEYLESLNYGQYNTGTAQPKLNKKVCASIPLIIPPLPEQRVIAAALSDVDALISALDKLITKKRGIKQATMQQLLTGKMRLPGFEGEDDENAKYKQTELGMVPEDWKIQPLNSICDVRDGTHESPKFHAQGVSFVTSKNIVNGVLDLDNVSYITEADAENFNKRSKVEQGDILMSMIGTIGNAVLINFQPDFCIKNVALLKPSKINSNYLIHLLSSPQFQKYLTNNLDGGIQKFISLGALRGLIVPSPSLPEQQAIAAILSDMDAEIVALEAQRDKTRGLKQGMMQELLTGKTRLV